MTATLDIAGSFVDVPHGRLWVEHAGEGTAVVFAHAGIGDRRMWDDQMSAFASEYHVVRYDQRGYGRSSAPTQPFSHVADLDAVLGHAGVERAVLVGSSVGGATVIDYALDYPERVAALVAVAAGLSGYPWQPTPAMAEFEAAVASGDHARMLDASLTVWAPLRTGPAVDERIRALIVDSLPGLRSLGRYWVEHSPAHGRLGSIGVSLLAVVGEADEPNFVRIAELLARDIPGAELVVLPGVDHNVAVRAAGDLTRLLTEFLDRTTETMP